MKKFLLPFIFCAPLFVIAQTEKYPVFKECNTVTVEALQNCFYEQVQKEFYKHFKEPTVVKEQGYKGVVNVNFIVTNKGDLKVVYVDSPYIELKNEIERVFTLLPKIEPAKYNNHTIEMQFVFPLSFPLSDDPIADSIVEESNKEDIQTYVKELENKSTSAMHRSQLNIPFSHQNYYNYEYQLHKFNKTHTATKPYLFSEIGKYVNFDSIQNTYKQKNANSWVGRKFWNEHLLDIEGKDYWFNMDFLLDVQLGKDNSDDVSYTYNNSRIFRINGGFGDKLSFTATIYESQARFAQYINQFNSNRSFTFKPAFSEGLVPGRGKAKGFGDDAYDYPVAEGYISYTPNDRLQFQFGHGKNFIGDGYRSMLLSDVSAPSLYLKATFNFWRFKYTNLWLWANDVRHPAVINSTEHARKYVAIHHLSINLSKRLNLGLFEAAMSASQNGIDAGFLNPLIFFRTVEFHRGEDAGNALVGVNAKYKLSDKVALYSQIVIDEFSFDYIKNIGNWENKFGYQLGAKYFDAFNVKNLYLQSELNIARPFTFSHKNPVLNYGHYSQPLAHFWGANFWEAIGIVRYKKDRWNVSATLVFGKKGFDDPDEVISYGGNIYQSYEDRAYDEGNKIAQGNKASIVNLNSEISYLINASNKMSLFARASYRNFSPENPTVEFAKNSNVWVSAGVRVDLFNWYFDF